MLKKLVICLLATTALQGALAAQLPEVTVYKDPDCGCCVSVLRYRTARQVALSGRSSSILL